MKCGVGVFYKKFSWNKCEFRENRHSRRRDVTVDAGFLRDEAAVRTDTVLCRRVMSFNLTNFQCVRY